MKLINQEMFSTDLFDQYTKAIIVGKGPTFKPVTKPDDNTILIGINHATAHLTNPDMMVAQDVEVWSEIPKAVKSLGFAVTPTYPHLKCRYVRSVTYQNVIEALTAAKFKGLYIPYNGLNSSIGGFIDMPKSTTPSSGNAAVGFVCLFMRNVKEITTYGIAAGESQRDAGSYKGHANIFKECSIPGGYTWGFNNMMRTSMENITKQHNIDLNIL